MTTTVSLCVYASSSYERTRTPPIAQNFPLHHTVNLSTLGNIQTHVQQGSFLNISFKLNLCHTTTTELIIHFLARDTTERKEGVSTTQR